jgi:hypothetical protein
MSPTTLRPGARALGALLLTAALAGAPAVASADTATPTPTASPSASATEPSATPSPSATATPSAEPTPSESPTATPSPSPSTTAPSATPAPSTSAPGAEPFVAGGDARRYGLAAAAGPATSTDPVLVGANYLEEQLRAGGHHFSVDVAGTLYPDYGVTADAVLALDAAGTGQTEATAATAYLAANVGNYASYDDGDPDTVDDIYAGSVAKLLNVAIAQGVDPEAFGGWDLVATLEARENGQGRFVDQSPFGDYSNTFGQSFALIGLSRARGSVTTAARSYLVAQQCPGGGFALTMTDAGCSSDANADPDATAMAVQALLVTGGASAAASDGLDYLADLQDADGAIGGAGPTAAPNANSTGLAGQAFLAGGRTAQARAAVGYLTDLQYGCALPAVVRGAVAYDQAAYDAKVGDGSSATPSDQDRRATTQALLALAGVPLGSVTGSGSDAEAPALACATATPTTTPTSSTDPTTTAPAGAGGTPSVTPVAAAPAGALAQTGADPLLPVLLGLALVLVGGVAVVASRRRGAHA